MSAIDSGIGYELSEAFPVSRERLFNALIDPSVLKSIWGVQEITVDPRVGGKANAVFIAEGQDWSFTLTYLEVVAPEKLRWVAHFKSFPSKETRVVIRIAEEERGARLTITMGNFETTEERDANRQAWQQGLRRLAGMLD
jgi:uncharacterized protein YndB with AHSA1/START domain